MALTLQTSARNAAADAVCALVNGGTMKITDSSDVVLSQHTLSATAFGSASSGTATANAIGTDTDADATGTAAKAKFYNSSAVLVFQGTVGASGSGADVIMNSTAIQIHASVSVSSCTYTQPAS